MCLNEKVAAKFFNILLAGNANGILDRQWGRKKSYVMKCKQ